LGLEVDALVSTKNRLDDAVRVVVALTAVPTEGQTDGVVMVRVAERGVPTEGQADDAAMTTVVNSEGSKPRDSSV